MNNFQVKWQDVREEVSRDRHSATNKFIALEALHDTLDARLKVLEADKTMEEGALKEKKNSQKKNDKRFNRIYAIITVLFGFFASFHWKDVRDFLLAIF